MWPGKLGLMSDQKISQRSAFNQHRLPPNGSSNSIESSGRNSSLARVSIEKDPAQDSHVSGAGEFCVQSSHFNFTNNLFLSFHRYFWLHSSSSHTTAVLAIPVIFQTSSPSSAAIVQPDKHLQVCATGPLGMQRPSIYDIKLCYSNACTSTHSKRLLNIHHHHHAR